MSQGAGALEGGAQFSKRLDFRGSILKMHKMWGGGQDINPFAPGDFAEKHVLKLVEWFSGHCRAIKS